jgi:bifunctional lysine-specific demethylase and histidyl-hydroxylase NO66
LYACQAIDMVDAACDQMGKRFMSERLPPCLTPEVRECTNNNASGQEQDDRILPTTLCRLAQSGIARLVLEDGKAVVYHCADNSRVYHEVPISPLEYEVDDAPALEQLITTVEPHWIRVCDLIHESNDDKISITRSLYDEGILAIINVNGDIGKKIKL